MVVFRKMIGILSRIHDDNSIAFARALDKVGFAASMSTSQQNLDWALLALKEALYLRFVHLGPHHTDTIDSLNNIAGVYLRMKKWAEAKEVYVDILTGEGMFSYVSFPFDFLNFDKSFYNHGFSSFCSFWSLSSKFGSNW